jgi:glycine betaine/proline transport system substrate-binding protein
MKIIIRIICVVLLSLCCIACNEAASKNTSIKIAYTNLESDIASANMVKLLLEKMGFEVSLLKMDEANSWKAVADGKADVMLNAWLPDTHSEHLKQYKDKVEDLGPNLIGTRVGLVVPEFVNILNIEELNSYYRQFDGNIFANETNAGLLNKTIKTMEIYKLDLVIIHCSEAEMLEKLASFISADEWIVITAQSPHWMFSQWRLKFLDDPEGVYGKDGTINTITRKGFSNEHPEAAHVIKNFYWDDMEIQSLMLMNHLHPESVEENTKKWLSEHPEIAKKWLSNANPT